MHMQFNDYSKNTNAKIFICVCKSRLTSSSLYQDRDSAVRTNQYSFAPPFMMLMLLIVSQPFLITWEKDEFTDTQKKRRVISQQANVSFSPFLTNTSSTSHFTSRLSITHTVCCRTVRMTTNKVTLTYTVQHTFFFSFTLIFYSLQHTATLKKTYSTWCLWSYLPWTDR